MVGGEVFIHSLGAQEKFNYILEATEVCTYNLGAAQIFK